MNWLDWIGSVPPILEAVILLAAFVAALYALKKSVYKPIRRHFDRVNSGMDTLLGYPPVLDPGSGREIQPATAPLSARVYDLEKNGADVSAALVTIANNQKQILGLQADVAERNKYGDAVVKEWTEWRNQHELESQAYADRIENWEQWRAEQAALWEYVRTNLAAEGTRKIVEAAHHHDPADDDPHRP